MLTLSSVLLATITTFGAPGSMGRLELVMPQVLSVTPDQGPVGVNTPVTITGHGFTGATAVMFGLRPASSFAVQSDTVITATTPADVHPRTVTVTVQ